MTDFFLSVLAVSISAGIIIIGLLALAPLLDKRYAAKWRYWIWIFLALRLLSVLRADALWPSQAEPQAAVLPKQDNVADVPAETARLERVIVRIPAQMTAPITVQSRERNIRIPLLRIAVLAWIGGGLLFMAVHLASYGIYKRRLITKGAVIEDRCVLHQLQALKQELAVRRGVCLVASSEAAGPMAIGFFRAVIVLPEEDFTAQELYFILKHELVHLKRGDTYLKLLLVAANAVHWFNPLVWLMRREAAVDMELSCDERVTKGADAAQRKAYTETLFLALHRQCRGRTALSTQFYGGKKVMKKRFQHILGKKTLKNGAGVLALVIVITAGLGMLVGCAAADEAGAPNPAEPVQSIQEVPALETSTANAPAESGESVTDSDIPDAVLAEAEAWTLEEYEYHKRVSPGNAYGDWRIESLAHCYTYENFEGMVLQVYRMNIQFLSDTPKDVALIGGMSVTGDGWVVPDYANSRYLVFRQEGDTLTLLTRMFENDCEAGDEVFTHDLEHQWNLLQHPQETPTLTINAEGEPYEIPAVLVQGNGYSFYLPEGEWYPSDLEGWADIDDEWEHLFFDGWTAWDNEEVRIWIARFEGQELDSVEKEMTDRGYGVFGDRLFRQNGEIIYGVELKAAGADTWGIFYCYPVDCEEGWGAQIDAFSDTFAAE